MLGTNVHERAILTEPKRKIIETIFKEYSVETVADVMNAFNDLLEVTMTDLRIRNTREFIEKNSLEYANLVKNHRCQNEIEANEKNNLTRRENEILDLYNTESIGKQVLGEEMSGSYETDEEKGIHIDYMP